MKYTNLRAFEKHLQEASPKHFSSLYMLLDKDPFSRKTAEDTLISALLLGKPKELALKLFSAVENRIEEILQEVDSPNFFSERCVIVIDQAEKLAKGSIEKLEPYFKSLPPLTYLILTGNALSSSTNFYKKVEKIGIILEIPEEKSWEKEKSLQAWIIAQAALQNKSIDEETSHALVKQLGLDKALLHHELNKLICYVGDKSSISVQDVAALCGSQQVESIWQLGEAIFRREAAAALRISKAMIDEGIPLLSLLRQLRSQFQTELEVCCILARGGTPADITQEFAYMKGTILSRHMQMAQNYGLKKLKEGLLLIDASELKAKNSMADPHLLNELLMVHLC